MARVPIDGWPALQVDAEAMLSFVLKSYCLCASIGHLKAIAFECAFKRVLLFTLIFEVPYSSSEDNLCKLFRFARRKLGSAVEWSGPWSSLVDGR